MNFEYDEAQQKAVAAFRAFCDETVRPVDDLLESAGALESAAKIRANLRAVAGAGGLGWNFPKTVGGRGLSLLETVAYVEAVGQASPATLVALDSSVGLAAAAIAAYGNEDQKKRYLPRLLDGSLLGAFAVTEWEAGSDVAGIKTAAVREGEGWEVYGQKAMIANAPLADVVVFLAVTKAAATPPGLSLFVANKGTKGLVAGPPLETMGLHGLAVGEIQFEGCLLPAGALLGTENQGAAMLADLMAQAKITLAAGCVGVASRIAADALAYAGTRKAFGKPIFNYQEVSFKFADMRTMIDGARLLCQYTAWLRDRGDREVPELAACAKLFASESLTWIAQAGLAVHGGLGYLKKCAMERLYRDARYFEIGLGTSELQRVQIARAELDRYR